MKPLSAKRKPIDPSLLKGIFKKPEESTMSDTGIIGSCKECEIVATLEIGPGFSLSKLDKVDGGLVVKAYCPICQKTVEFVPHQNFLDEAHRQVLEKQRKIAEMQ